MERTFFTTPIITEHLKKSMDVAVYTQSLDRIETWLSTHGLQVEDYRLQSLSNHVMEMVNRAHKQAPLTGLDVSMFADIGPVAYDLANELCVLMFQQVIPDEAGLLSVHFEVMLNG